MEAHLKRWVKQLQRHSRRWWYGPAIAALACADLFVIVVPTDGLLVSASMLAPRRWLYFAIIVTIGSAFGAWLLAVALHTHGMPFLLGIFPDIEASSAWIWTEWLMDNWGEW